MNTIMNFFRDHAFGLSLLFSTFWGARAAFLFASDPVERLPAGQKETFFLRKSYPKIGVFFIMSYHFIFNFIGSLAGWCVLAILLNRLPSDLNVQDLKPFDGLLFAIALLGLTGHLPQSVASLMEAMTGLAAKAAKKLEEPK